MSKDALLYRVVCTFVFVDKAPEYAGIWGAYWFPLKQDRAHSPEEGRVGDERVAKHPADIAGTEQAFALV